MKFESLISVTDWGIEICFNFVHLSKALDLIATIDDENDICSNEEQPEKVEKEITVNKDGIDTCDNE